MPADAAISEVASRLLSNIMLERSFVPGGLHNARISFRNVMNAYSFVFPRSQPATHDQRMCAALEALLADVPTYEVTVPRRAEAGLFEQLCNAITGLL